MFVAKLSCDSKVVAKFTDRHCYIRDQTMEIVEQIDELNGGLYQFTSNSWNSDLTVQKSEKSISLWHKRLSHVPQLHV